MNSASFRETATWAFWRLAAAALIVAATAVAASAQYCTPDQCDECDLVQSPPELLLRRAGPVAVQHPLRSQVQQPRRRLRAHFDQALGPDVPSLDATKRSSRFSPKKRRCPR